MDREYEIYRDYYKTGFYYFFKWQYLLRHDFLNYIDQMDFESYLKTVRDEKDKYLDNSENLLQKHLNNDLKLSHLLTLTPRWVRTGQHLVNFSFEDPVLKMEINLDKVKVQNRRDQEKNRDGTEENEDDSLKTYKVSLMEEIEGALRMAIDYQRGDAHLPEQFKVIGSKNSWESDDTDIKSLYINLVARLTGLVMWDWRTIDNLNVVTMMDIFHEKYPFFKVETKQASNPYNKYEKRFYRTKKCIQKGKFFDLS